MKKFTDLNRRLAVSSVAILIVAVLIGFSFSPIVGWFLMATVALLAAIGVWEYAQLAAAKALHPSTPLMIVIAACEVAAFFISLRYLNWPLLPVVVLFLGTTAIFLKRFRGVSASLVHIAVEFFGVCYVVFPLCFMLGILYPESGHAAQQDGRWWLFYLIVVTKITDAGAYFGGYLWGKHPLAPSLSPKKTIEGAAAGFICAILGSIAMAKLGKTVSDGSFELTLVEAFWLGGLISFLGQVGDLAESLLKRDAVVKDSNTLPGVGGVLDLIDSLLFTAPIVYFFVRAH